MRLRAFAARGIRRPVNEDLRMLRWEPALPGTLSFGELALTFNEWQVPYKAIKSAAIYVQYVFGFPLYQLLLTDGTNSFIFQMPRAEIRAGLPFEVQRHGEKTLLQRFSWLGLPGLFILFGVFMAVVK